MKKARTVYLLQLLLIFSCSLPRVASSTQPGTSFTMEAEASSAVQTDVPPHSLAVTQPSAAELLLPEDLTYLGAFRLPGESGGSSWEYSGHGLTFYPDGDPSSPADGFPGSLFGVGHDHQQFVSEITIPAPVLSRNLDDLPVAQTLQPFADITGGIFGVTELPRLGLEYLPPQGQQISGKLYYVHGQHFQDFEPSHGWSELDLKNPQPAGPWLFDGYTNYVTSDYIFEIPEVWAAVLPGQPRLATGRFREGVWGGRGPALFAFSPWQEGNPPPSGATLNKITPLLLYGTQEPGQTDIISDETTQMIGYLEPDHWWDGAWLTAGDKATVIFAGTKALGRAWYGFANGVVWDYDCAEQVPSNCPDPPEWPYENRGYWADDYQAQLIFFDPAALVVVANGQVQTWQPQPYASLDLNQYFLDPRINLGEYKQDLVGAAAFDRQNGLLYVLERLADGYKSVVHVFQIQSD